mmetsp:Transcript_54337/g.132795  ORF Transcript_54337/g.132795 Transcript_54337/m.132795 type:complete len:263 (-) Transcript_54337:1926-2714(-)
MERSAELLPVARRIERRGTSRPDANSCMRRYRSFTQSRYGAPLPPSCTVYAGRSRSSLKTIMPPSWPAARRFCSGWTARIQKRSCSRRKVCMPVRFDMSKTLIDLSSELEMMSSCFGWNMQHDTLFTCPRSVSTSQALVSFIRHSLTCLSSAPDTMSGRVGWKDAQFTPRSCPSSRYLTTASVLPKRSVPPALALWLSPPPPPPPRPGGGGGGGGQPERQRGGDGPLRQHRCRGQVPARGARPWCELGVFPPHSPAHRVRCR